MEGIFVALWVYFHQLDPFIIQFTETMGIRWYSMAYIVGVIVGYYVVHYCLVRNRVCALLQKDWADLIMWAVFGMILGGRLGYAVFYHPKLFIEWDGSFPFWGLLKVHQGGLASHGGILGLAIAVILFARLRGFIAWHCLDLVCFPAGLGIFFGRCANFINGELYGRIVANKALVAVQFPKEMLSWVFNRKIEYLKELGPAVSALKNPNISQENWQNWMYQASSLGKNQFSVIDNQIYATIYALISACEKGSQEVITALQPILSYRHPSQIYQAILEGLVIFVILWLFWRKTPRRAGSVSILFGITYALMRIAGEMFRMPDTQLGFRALGITRGQWLSIIMLVCLFIGFLYLTKHPSKKRWGGWLQPN